MTMLRAMQRVAIAFVLAVTAITGAGAVASAAPAAVTPVAGTPTKAAAPPNVQINTDDGHCCR